VPSFSTTFPLVCVATGRVRRLRTITSPRKAQATLKLRPVSTRLVRGLGVVHLARVRRAVAVAHDGDLERDAARAGAGQSVGRRAAARARGHPKADAHEQQARRDALRGRSARARAGAEIRPRTATGGMMLKSAKTIGYFRRRPTATTIESVLCVR
jgi:hypothetical protein